ELGLGLAQRREGALGVAGEHAGGVGQRDAAAAPLEQRLADLARELGDLLRDRRRRDVQHLGGGLERAVAGDGVEGAKTLETDHVAILKETAKNISLVLN